MFVLMRALTYAILFIGFVFVYLPSRVLLWAGVSRPAALGGAQSAGIVIASLGGVLALWCIGAFVALGKGTQAPFDPPRQLVVGGPYRLVRNPMYWGALLVIAGGTLYYQSIAPLAFGGAFLLIAHLFVVLYEEPVLRRRFGPAYTAYCGRVHRWWPHPAATR
jgi:protein-S-isoprenylcysteine O-methyltransferase Ste14